MEYYSATKEYSNDPYNLDDIQKHAERSQSQRLHTAWFHLYDILKKTKL